MTATNAALSATQAPQRPVTFDAFEVDRLDDDALDALPFGVICIDRRGTILRYNAAEARLARLDRDRVLGRIFFGEVAPCTKTPEFFGRFEAFAEAGGRSIERFDYLFDFKFGAQRVQIEMLRPPGTDRFYLLVNRRTFEPARDGLEPGFAAPLLRELIGEERGVLRDEREQRVAEAPAAIVDALARTCERVAPKTWEIFCREWGLQWGRRSIVDLETRCLEETGLSLRERSMSEVAGRVDGYLATRGWGSARFHFDMAKSGVVRVELEHSLLAEAVKRGGLRRCHLIAGWLEAVLNHLGERRLHVDEVSCVARGDARCELWAVGPTRRDRLGRAIELGLTGELALEALHGT